MIKTLFCILFTVAVFGSNIINGTIIFRPLKPSESYTHTLIVNDDIPTQYVIFWKLINNSLEIQFEVHCRTTGWIGLGFSQNGGMAGSDVVIGWVKDGQTHLKDCYAASKTAPRIDAQQDYTLLEGAEIEGYTILKFSRKLVTCDVLNDMEIKLGSQFMIFAWNNADPITGINDWVYHGSSNRFTKTTLLLSYKDEDIEEQGILPPDVFAAPLRFSNLAIPAQSTYYYCDIFALPVFTKPVHFIQYEMIVNPLYKKNVHHLLAYECDDDYVLTAPLARECGRRGVPGSVGNKCMQKMILAWGIGGPLNYTFPKNTGYRFEASGRTKYILIEIHYDNPQLLSNIVDDSGVQLYFTEQLREQDLGLLMLGTDGSTLSLQIPPKSKDFSHTSICYPTCSERFFPADGITVLSGFLHTHLAGRSVKTTLVQNNIATRELFANPNYDFNYQFVIDIEPIKLRKGDALITECRYETNDREDFTFFGFSTYDEMCYDFVYYYPKIPTLQQCVSQTPNAVLTSFYQSLMNEGLVPTIPLSQVTSQSQILNFFQTQVTPSKALTERFEEFFASKYNKSILCGSLSSALVQNNVLHYTPISNDIIDSNSCS